MIIVLNEPIRETIQVLCNDLNLLLKNKLKNDNIIENDKDLEIRHYGNIFMFDIKTLQYNILEHNMVPEHIVYRNSTDIEKILDDCNCTIDQLPIILKNDPVAKLKMLVPGDICKIMRMSKTCGEYPYYRVCK
jgi:DNA-directed RNA polymerase subunit H (RpoH/RPB5)